MDRFDPVVDEDELFLWAPSAVMAATMEANGELFEGKAIGTAKEQDLVLLSDPTLQATLNPDAFSAQRKSGVTVGRKKLKETMATTEAALLLFLADYDSGKIDERTLRQEVTRTMKSAWRQVFVAGVRAGGQPPTNTPGVLAKVSPVDEAWLKSAMQHEMRFLNKFLAAVTTGTGKIPYPKRANMYVRALSSFYESARVIALPADVIIHWAGPHDHKTCASCAYIFAQNPFTKKTLPTAPRAGATLCLTNCRDRLMIRRVAPEDVLAAQEAGLARSTHIANLRKIKAKGHL